MEWIVEAETLSDFIDHGRYTITSKPLIRCKDCKFYVAYDYTGKLMCKRIWKGKILPKPEDYCSYAEEV